MTTMTPDKTARGFDIIRFTDRYNVPCAVQKSSIATEDCIWIGSEKDDPRILVPNEGWQSVVIPGLLTNSQMHLTIDQVRALLPILQRFVDTGEIT